MRHKITTPLLWALIGFGFLGALNVSYFNYIGEQPCPKAAGLSICYVVTLAYGLMLVSLFIKEAIYHSGVFLPAWSITFFIALYGSSLELTVGDTCPRAGNLMPLCYVSLAMCLLIVTINIFHRQSVNISSG